MNLRRWMTKRPPAPPRLYDVALTMRGDDGAIVAPLISCVMVEADMLDLAWAWRKALEQGAETAAANFWATINGQTIYHGVILTNITSITGALVPAAAGEP